MPRTRKSHPPGLKAKVAVEAIKAHKKQQPRSRRCSASIRPRWAAGRNRRWPVCPTCSATAANRSPSQSDAEKDPNSLQADRPDESGVGLSQKKSWPHRLKTNGQASIPVIGVSAFQRQCELLGVPRSTWYYQPRPESAENLRLLRQLDQLYLESARSSAAARWPSIWM